MMEFLTIKKLSVLDVLPVLHLTMSGWTTHYGIYCTVYAIPVVLKLWYKYHQWYASASFQLNK